MFTAEFENSFYFASSRSKEEVQKIPPKENPRVSIESLYLVGDALQRSQGLMKNTIRTTSSWGPQFGTEGSIWVYHVALCDVRMWASVIKM